MSRPLTATILLMAFVVSQYAKHISYLDCKLSNYYGSKAKECDCEKIIADPPDLQKSTPAPINHRHVRIEESYFSLTGLLQVAVPKRTLPVYDGPGENTGTTAGFPRGIFHPPLVG